MNLGRIIGITAAVVMAAAMVGQLDRLQRWIWLAQAKVVYESRASHWGSPRFFSFSKEGNVAHRSIEKSNANGPGR